MVQPCVLLQTCFEVYQQGSKVCPSQIQSKVFSMFWKTKEIVLLNSVSSGLENVIYLHLMYSSI